MPQEFPVHTEQFSDSQTPPKKQGCIGFNLKTFVFGCFGCVVLCGGFGLLSLGVVMNLIKSSTPYTQAVAAAKTNSEIKAKLGTPIKEAFFSMGSVNTSTVNNVETGSADIFIPISGPTAGGTIHVIGTVQNGKWVYSIMDVEIGTEHVNLLKGIDVPANPDKSNSF